MTARTCRVNGTGGIGKAIWAATTVTAAIKATLVIADALNLLLPCGRLRSPTLHFLISIDPSRFPALSIRLPGCLPPLSEGKNTNSIRLEEERMGRRDKTSREDKTEGAMDKAKGRLKEARGALTGDRTKKAEGRADQRRGTLKEKKGHLKDLFK
jgi:uncharacterized protein YjbJ (UPF0337 family)